MIFIVFSFSYKASDISNFLLKLVFNIKLMLNGDRIVKQQQLVSSAQDFVFEFMHNYCSRTNYICA